MSDLALVDSAPAGSAKAGRAAQTALAATLALGSLAWCTDILRRFGFTPFPEQLAAAAIALALGIVFLRYPAKRNTERTSVPWYDWLASAAGLGAAGYIAAVYPELQLRLVESPPDAIVASALIFVLCLDGLRRTVGWSLLIVVFVAVGYALVGHLMPGALGTRYVAPERLLLYLNLDTSALLGNATQIGATVVIAFVFFGALLSRSGGSGFFNDIAVSLFGRSRGGPAKVSVAASSLFGMISGLAVANIMATGIVTIPMMRRAGYPPHLASAVEATAATGGQLMPPVMGAVAFLMADFLQISYAEVCLAAAIPSLLYYGALFIQADLDAARWGFGRVEESEIPALGRVISAGSIFMVPFTVLIGTLFFLNWEAELAAIAASLALIVIGLVRGYGGKRLTIRHLWLSVVETGFGVIDILMVVAAAGFIMGVFQATGLGFALTAAMVDLGAGNKWLLLLLAAALSTVLGMGLPTLSVYVLVAVLFAPALVEVGISPIAAHLFLLYFGMMSMITPPVALAAYFAASLSGASAMRTGYSAMRFGWTAFIVPFLFVVSPSLILRSSLFDMLIAVPFALLGVWLISAALSGFLLLALSMAKRLAFSAAGILMLLPHDAFDWGLRANLAGLAVAALLFTAEVRSRRAAATVSAS